MKKVVIWMFAYDSSTTVRILLAMSFLENYSLMNIQRFTDKFGGTTF